jgi:hypothetical protein
MESDLLGTAAMLRERIRDTRRRRPFEAAVRDFSHLLSIVTDYPALHFSDATISGLTKHAEWVVAEVEHRLDIDAYPGDNQVLAEAVYKIQRRLENIHRWRQHYLHAS